jgi:hypothetical protein
MNLPLPVLAETTEEYPFTTLAFHLKPMRPSTTLGMIRLLRQAAKNADAKTRNIESGCRKAFLRKTMTGCSKSTFLELGLDIRPLRELTMP